jgi:hypothetical protein
MTDGASAMPGGPDGPGYGRWPGGPPPMTPPPTTPPPATPPPTTPPPTGPPGSSSGPAWPQQVVPPGPYLPPGDGSWTAGAPPPYSPPQSADRVRNAWQGRDSTDYIFNYWTALGWTVLTLGIYGYYVFYQLVRRMRDHNFRRLELLDATVTFAWEEAGRRGLQGELTPSFQRAAAHLGVLRKMTSDFREPLVWMLLTVIAGGIVHVVAFILLDQDLVKHDQAEVGVEYEIALIFGRLGQTLPFPDPGRVKGRHNYVARVLVAIFTFGFYFLWWYHDMMVEPNRHFYMNWSEEDILAAKVQALL